MWYVNEHLYIARNFLRNNKNNLKSGSENSNCEKLKHSIKKIIAKESLWSLYRNIESLLCNLQQSSLVCNIESLLCNLQQLSLVCNIELLLCNLQQSSLVCNIESLLCNLQQLSLVCNIESLLCNLQQSNLVCNATQLEELSMSEDKTVRLKAAFLNSCSGNLVSDSPLWQWTTVAGIQWNTHVTFRSKIIEKLWSQDC